jgi:hypothetical protein
LASLVLIRVTNQGSKALLVSTIFILVDAVTANHFL